MVILGIICLILGLILGIPVLWTIGIVLAVVGAVLFLLARSYIELIRLMTDMLLPK